MLRAAITDYYEADGLGSVTSLSDFSGAIAETYTYDSYGKLTAAGATLNNPFRYTGREWDADAGLYYYRARYLDANSGRFATEDDLGFQAGSNFYRYIDNNPLNRFDPSGHQAQEKLKEVVERAPAALELVKKVPPQAAPPILACAANPVCGLVLLDAGLLAFDSYMGYKVVKGYLYSRDPAPNQIPKSCSAKKGGGKDCDAEWLAARQYCLELLALPNPPRGLTGGYKDVESCAKGFVSEECGGNPIDWGKKGPPKPKK